MKHILYFLSILLSLSFCLTSCEQNNQPEEEQEDHQPKYPGSFKLAGKVYVGTSKTMEYWNEGWYAVYKFSEDSIWRYDTQNNDLSPMPDIDYLSKTTYILKYPNIEVNEYPWPHIFTMKDTLTIIDPNGGTCILR